LLAERMKVSRSALREAMKVLSAKGLVEARPQGRHAGAPARGEKIMMPAARLNGIIRNLSKP
jgi:DNA-binding FadR family transcriptional regulator